MIKLRKVTDIRSLLEWRVEVIYNVFGVEPGRELVDANKSYYASHVPDGTHVAVIASFDGADCGCGAVCFSDELPSPENLSGRCAYLMNIYVRKPFRNKGVAHAVVRCLIEEAQSRGCGKIYLETTAEGRPLYAEIGFEDMKDMMKYAVNINFLVND